MARKAKTHDKPAFNVYVVDDRGDDQDAFWLKVGAAFPHKDEKGFNLILQALPPSGRLVLREYKEPEGHSWLRHLNSPYPNSSR